MNQLFETPGKGRPASLLLVTPSLQENSLGRTYCLWLLAKSLGWQVTVVSAHGESIWSPLADTDFAQDCQQLSPARPARADQLRKLAKAADYVVAVKALPSSLGMLARALRRCDVNIVLDYDDPDLEVWTPGVLGWRRFVLRIGRHPVHYLKIVGTARIKARIGTLLVSNPVLQRRHGGTVVPHVRPTTAIRADTCRDKSVVQVAFVGTARKHKGIDVLREAVSLIRDRGFQLIVTDVAPDDAKSWEQWLGNLPFAAAMAVVSESDIVAVPSLDDPFANGQLPAKIMDALAAGRPVVGSDIQPIPWAIGPAGVVVTPGSAEALAEGLLKLVDPEVRSRFATLARERAKASFSVEAIAPIFEQALLRSADGKRFAKQEGQNR